MSLFLLLFLLLLLLVLHQQTVIKVWPVLAPVLAAAVS